MKTIRRLTFAVPLALAAASFAPAAHGHDGGEYTWRNVQIVGGGYVPGIVFNAKEPGLVYARTDIGGAYRLSTRTGRWIPLLDGIGWDDWNLTGVESIATDPVDPDRVYVLAGTYTNFFAPSNGAVLRSRDRGRTWERSDLPFKVGGNMPGRNMGERLAIDPGDHRVLLLGARSGNGLWRSSDFGRTWARVASFPATGSYVPDPSDGSGYNSDPIGVTWEIFDPRSSTGGASRTIYVGVADLGTSIYRSTDAGATWGALPGQPTRPAFMPSRAVLASNGVLYVTYNNNAGPFDGTMGDVWKYDTTAAVWTKINPDFSSTTNSWFGYGGLAVDAQHPDTLMVSALNQWWPDVSIWRSTDAGASWRSIWEWGAYPNRIFHYVQDISAAPWLTFNTSPGLPEVTPKLGWMVGDLEIDPFDSNRMFYGTGATIYGTDDLTDWDAGGPITITVKAQGLEETAVQDFVSPPQGPPLVSALGDIAGFRHDDLTVVPPRMFSNPTPSTTNSLDFAEAHPAVIWRAGCCTSVNAAYSTDGGSTWTPAAAQPGGASGGTIAVSSDGASVVWSVGGGVFRSTDNGASWTPSAGVSAGARVGSDRVDPNAFYAFAGGTFYASADGGATFAATGAAGLPSTGSARFKAVPGFKGQIWLAGGSAGNAYGLWVSRDSGASFKKLRHVDEADVVGFGKAAPGRHYPAVYTSAKVRGLRGIFRSDDAGDEWVRVNDDRHQYGSTGQAISGDPRVYGRVYVSTNGRGIVYGEPAHDGGRDHDHDHR